MIPKFDIHNLRNAVKPDDMEKTGDAFFSVPDVEPDTQHRIAVFRVL